jgi:hypothetical protein
MTEQANIIFSAEAAASLRDLAASLGFYINRGPGSGEIGNIKAMLNQLARVYEQSPEVVQAFMLMLVNWKQKDTPDARPWMDTVYNHAWLGAADEVPDVCPVCGDESGQISTVPDLRRVHGDEYKPYPEKTAWECMANRALALEAQENFRDH